MAKRFYNSKEWYKVRQKALFRDKFRCRMCDKLVAHKGEAKVDHIKPRRTHPELELEITNLQVLCCTCHDSIKKRDENSPNRGTKLDGTPNDPDSPWAHY